MNAANQPQRHDLPSDHPLTLIFTCRVVPDWADGSKMAHFTVGQEYVGTWKYELEEECTYELATGQFPHCMDCNWAIQWFDIRRPLTDLDTPGDKL